MIARYFLLLMLAFAVIRALQDEPVVALMFLSQAGFSQTHSGIKHNVKQT